MPGHSLQPRAGFNWQAVSWGGPDEVVSEICSVLRRPDPRGRHAADPVERRRLVRAVLLEMHPQMVGMR